jgi:flagellar basal body-associated protein FliL
METPLGNLPQQSVPTAQPARKFTIPLVAAGVVVAAAALGYTVGVLKKEPAPQASVNTNAPTAQAADPELSGNEVPFVADTVSVGGKMVLTGTISHLTNQGFELEVTKPVVNTASRTVGSRTTYYSVRLTPTTKLTQYTFTSTIPPQGGEPEVKQTVTKLVPSNLEEGEVATVTGSAESNGLNLVALDVRITSVVKQ